MTELHLDRQAVPAKHKGAWAEMVACVWLLQQGYEVFRNVSPSGGTDIVAIKGAEVLRFDVKSYSDAKVLACRTPEQIALGIRFLVIRSDGTVEISDGNPPMPPKIECRICEQPFKPSHKSQRICSEACRREADRKANGRYVGRRKPVEANEISGGRISVEIVSRDTDPVSRA